MSKIREIVSKNLITLRKKSGMTQADLSKKINYSDKAISRWEKGEVLPDLETLENVAKVYGVSVKYLIEEHEDEIKLQSGKPTKNEILQHILTICVIWTILMIVFVYVKSFENVVFWQIFIWGIPITLLYSVFFTRKWQNATVKIVLQSITIWAILISLYLQFLELNLYLIFLVGIPVQGAVVVSAISKPRKIIKEAENSEPEINE